MSENSKEECERFEQTRNDRLHVRGCIRICIKSIGICALSTLGARLEVVAFAPCAHGKIMTNWKEGKA